MTAFVIADLHFGDEATCTRYRRPDGSPLRPFANAREMDGEIVRRWNETVSDRDTVYVLGDIGRRENALTVRSLNGQKHLIGGNGDDLAAIMRWGLFESVGVVKYLPGFLMTHIPVHPSQLDRRTVNVHGHLHARSLDDARYLCVSVEQTGFKPLRIDRLSRRTEAVASEQPPRLL